MFCEIRTGSAVLPTHYRWMLWDIYTVEYYSGVTKKKTLPFATV